MQAIINLADVELEHGVYLPLRRLASMAKLTRTRQLAAIKAILAQD